MLDRPRTSTLPLGHQHTKACRSSGRLTLPDLRGLITHNKCRTGSHEHERSCERENYFRETRDGSRAAASQDKSTRLSEQIGETEQGSEVWAYTEDLSESGEHAQAPKERANLQGSLS